MDDVPDVYAILESISILWAIWCGRNNFVFQQSQVDVSQDLKNAYFWYQMMCRLQQKLALIQVSSGLQTSSANGVVGNKRVVLKFVVGAELMM